MRRSWFWPLIILLSGIATELVIHLLPGQEITMLVTMWFLFVCPGMAFLRFFRLGTLVVEITIAVALSLSIDAVVTGIFLYAHAWNPTYTLLSLIICSSLAAIGQLVFMREPAIQVAQNDLSIVGAGKVEEAATVAVPATHIAALIRNEDKRTVKAASVMAHADELSGLTEAKTVAHMPAFPPTAIEEISTRMLPTAVPQKPRLVEEVPTNMLPSIPATPRLADELPTNMMPIVHNNTRNTVENMPTSMLPSMPPVPMVPTVPTTPRLNEDLPTNMFPTPSTDELARKGQKSSHNNGKRGTTPSSQEQERGSSSRYSQKKNKLTSLKRPLSSPDTDRPIEDRSTIISIKEH